MAAPNPTKTVTNPRIAKLIELEVSGRIKPEHQRELDTYRAQGLAPKKSGTGNLTEAQGKSTGFYERALEADKNFTATEASAKPRGLLAQTAADALPGLANTMTSADRQLSEQAKRNFIMASLRYESGAAIGKDEFVKQDIAFFPQPGDSPATIAQKARDRQVVVESLKAGAGGGPAQIESQRHQDQPAGAPSASATPPPIGVIGSPPPAGPPSVPLPANLPPDIGIGDGVVTDLQGAFGGGPQGADAAIPDQLAVSTNGVKTEVDPELVGLRQHIAGMVAAGASAKAIRDTLTAAGMDPASIYGIDENVAFRKANPGYKGGYNVQIGVRDIPMSAARSALSSAAASPGGAYAISAADTVLGGGLDELAPGNTNLHRLGIDAVENANPNASAAGLVTGIAGNVATTMGGEGLLARGAAEFAPKLVGLAAPVADTAFGVTSGALSSNDDRLKGALTGGLAGLGGGALGRTLGRIIAPTGGKLGSLYENGVKPTLGQRFVGTGLPGNIVNGTEEILQSVPIAGFAVRGARQKARDQFERGAFNDALSDIGHKLPDAMELGNEPHAFMQEKFNDAYDKVRGQMNFVPDSDYTNDLAKFQTKLDDGTLSDEQARSVRKVIENAVDSRVGNAGGALTGDGYKAAISQIEQTAADLAATDPLRSKALTAYANIFDAATRRNTPASAVAAMDAVDRGYAKSVIIEDAARRRGTDTGRFTPTQLDAAVQNMSGGVRSRAYLRGDALLGDYATAGKSLVDRIPNSGTADRILATQALGGAPVMGALGFASPASAALVGAATLPYAPIARDVVAGALAPRSTPALRTLGDLIRSRGGGPAAALAVPTANDLILGQ